jgi:hypothetical protein
MLSIAGVQLGGGSTSNDDVTGELMPLILDQLQSSLEITAASSAPTASTSGSGIHNHSGYNIIEPLSSKESQSCESQTNHESSISSSSGSSKSDSSTSVSSHGDRASKSNLAKSVSGDGGGGGEHNNNRNTSSHNNNNSSSSSNNSPERSSSVGGDDEDGGVGAEDSSQPDQECLFDSGTESGEDVAPVSSSSPTPAPNSSSQLKTEELCDFMEGLRNTLKRNQTKESLLSSYSSQLDAFLGESASGAGSAGASISANIGSDSAFAKVIGGDGGGESYKDNTGLDTLLIEPAKSIEDNREKSGRRVSSEEASLVQQVDKVLSLLRDTLVKDPKCATLPVIPGLDLTSDPSKGRELVALIDRLKASLVDQTTSGGETGASDSQLHAEAIKVFECKEEEEEITKLVGGRRGSILSNKDFPTSKRSQEDLPYSASKEDEHSTVIIGPAVITGDKGAGVERRTAEEMLAWAQNRPPDIVPLPWVNHIQSTFTDERKKSMGGEEDVPWKMRASKRRSHGRSHTVGVTQEELAEARRYLQEAAFRSALQEQNQTAVAVEQQQQRYENEVAKQEETTRLEMEQEKELDLEISNALSKSNTLPSSHGGFASLGERDDLTADRLESSSSVGYNVTNQTEGKSDRSASSWLEDVEKGLTRFPRPFVKGKGMYDAGYEPPPERRMTYASIDDSRGRILGRVNSSGSAEGQSNPTTNNNARIKPFRTFSLDNAYDPSKSFFTKEETVQIAIHQAAIKKQMSEEEDRRKRRNSLSSSHNIYGAGSGGAPNRDFSLALPKPYSPPEKQQLGQGNGSTETGGDSGYTEESGSDTRQPMNDQLVLYQSSQMSPAAGSGGSATTTTTTTTTFLQQSPSSPNGGGSSGGSNKRIENVQISLKELSSSDFPQLQIAITLNTNNGNGPSLGSNSNGNTGNDAGSMQVVQFNTNQSNAVAIPSGSNVHNTNNNNNLSSIKQQQQQSHIQQQPSIASASAFTGVGESGSQKAMRYKSKNERKKRMKRANTIDIPQPPGFLLSHDDNSEMEDEEDSDSNQGFSKDSTSGGSTGNNMGPSKSQFTYAPFTPKSDGDKKFLAFLEKNNAIPAAPDISKAPRPSYLGANDKFWNNRFFNLKSSFESSSQGSSPSPSPILSPTNRPPRSVSEMTLTHGNVPSDAYSKPVWASTDPGQLPPQVKNKLHVFENKMDGGPMAAPWRSSAPQIHTQHQDSYGASSFGPSQSGARGPQNQFVSSSSVYTTSNMRAPFAQDNNKFNQLKKATPSQTANNAPSEQGLKTEEGVHMVHATAAALEAMKRSGFRPTTVVPPQVRAVPVQNKSQPPQLPPKAPLQPQERIELPWAKKEQSPFEVVNSRDPNAGRILMSKAKFELMNQPEIVPMHPPVSHHGVDMSGPAPPIPPKNTKSYNNHQAPRAPMMTTQQNYKSFPTSSVPNVSNLPSNYGQQQQQQQLDYGSMQSITSPKLGTLGTAQSFDEALSRKVENEQPQYIKGYPNQPHRGATGFQTAPGSAFARKVPVQQEPLNQQIRDVSTQETENDVTENNAAVKKSSSGNQDGVHIQTPVLAKVMGGTQQQRAVVTGNRMTSRHDEAPATATRLSNARSNIRNILSQYQAPTGQSAEDSDTSPPILRANLQLSMPPLSKSMSGDSLLQGHYRPKSLVVGPEELTLQGLSPHHLRKPFTPSPASVSPGSIPSASPPSSGGSGSGRIKISFPVQQRDSPQYNHQQQHHPAIPRQRSLSEFPKLGPVPNIGVLTIQTNMDSMSRPSPQKPKLASNVPVQQKQQSKPTVQQQQQQMQKPQQPQPIQQQQQRQTVSQQQHTQHRQQQPAVATAPKQVSSAPKVLKSYPATDSLQRTSSGSSIFNRAQSLFLSAHETGNIVVGGGGGTTSSSGAGGMPPSTKARTKPPSLPKTHGVFPKQFEAQMSPDSANKKQREIETYFRQQQQQQLKEEKQRLQAASVVSKAGSQLRKSASHSKIMSRQRSLSDGEEDVDKIFESLFKASGTRSMF